MGGMMPWATRNQMINGYTPMNEDLKTCTENVVANLKDSVLKHRLCGEDCRKCEVRCNYGIEALKRGLDVTEEKREKQRRGRIKMLPQVLERPEGYWSCDEMAVKWQITSATMEHWVLSAKIHAVCRFYAGHHKVLSLYCERDVMDRLMAFTADGRHEIMKGRLLKIKEAQGL